MMLRKISLSFSFLLLSHFLQAQHIIKGQVKDKESGKPLENVHIRIIDSEKGTVSKAGGFFELESDRKKAMVKVSHIGYTTPKLKIKSGNKDNLIGLEKTVYSLQTINLERGESNKIFYKEFNEIEYKKMQELRERSYREGEMVLVENHALFYGGMKNFYAFFPAKFRFPAKAIQDRQEGKIYLRFQIDESGNPVDPVILAGDPENGIGEEIIRVFKLMPKWHPASQRGNPVKVNFVLPIFYSAK